MRKINPNIYAEAFGILYRKHEKEDCRKILERILKKIPAQKKELATAIFAPVIEMMDCCADLVLNPENPLYVPCASNVEGHALFSNLFFEYYDIEKDESPLMQIPATFSENQGKYFIQSALLTEQEEQTEDPISAILHSKWSSEDKLLLMNILVDGTPWIREFCLLLEETAHRITPILKRYENLYSYLDQLFSPEDICEELFQRIHLKPIEDASILPVLSTCNTTFVREKTRNTQIQFTIFMGILHCAIDFSEFRELTREQLCEGLKCLSDPTKLSILTILKEQSTYQTDLARQLGLTTATISHHMNKLLQNGFVKYQFADKKSYYEYQPEQVDMICAQLKKLLG